jgi:3-oxoacyl-[acyl-carrier protein] reductase
MTVASGSDPGERRVALVTGGSGGIGGAVARALANLGYAVVVHYHRNRAAAEAVVGDLGRGGRSAWALGADLSVTRETATLFRAIDGLGAPLQVVVHAAGGLDDRRLTRLDEEAWDRVVDSHLKSAWLILQQAGARMVARGDGHLLLIASIAGLRGRVGQANYASAKAGMIGLAKAAARELGPAGVRVNAILPGFLHTPMTAGVPEAAVSVARQDNVLGRFSTADEVAGVIAHLATTRHISGQVFNLDSRIC